MKFLKFMYHPSKIVEELIVISFFLSVLVKIETSSEKCNFSKASRKQSWKNMFTKGKFSRSEES